MQVNLTIFFVLLAMASSDIDYRVGNEKHERLMYTTANSAMHRMDVEGGLCLVGDFSGT